MVSSFSLHADREEAIARGQAGFEFFGYALNALVAHDTVPGRTNLWNEYLAGRAGRNDEPVAAAGAHSSGIGTPDDMRRHLDGFEAAGVDQVIFMQQAERNRHDHICEALELFAAELMPRYAARVVEREARKAEELAPFVAAAMARKSWMKPLADDEIPVVRASVAKAQVNR
jgi:hypothetical protein